MSVSRITPHFSWRESDCHDGTPVPPELTPNARRLAEMLERLRGRFGGVLVPISWYRTAGYNLRVGGAQSSQHMLGHAADVRPGDLGALGGLHRCIADMLGEHILPELGGLGVYPGWIHLDCRARPPSGHVARWAGVGVGSELA